jgi:ATP-dependent protease ClpP protease subunit
MHRTPSFFIGLTLLLSTQSALALELTDRRVTIGTELSLSAARSIADKLFRMDATSMEPILLYINTRRGYTPAAMVIVDAIAAVKSKVYGVVQAEAFGPGAVVAAFCDQLYLFPHASLLYEKLEYDSERTMKEKPPLPIAAATGYLDRARNALAKRLHISPQTYIKRVKDGGWYLTAAEAKQTRIVTGIVDTVTWVDLVTETVEIKRTRTSKEKETIPVVR